MIENEISKPLFQESKPKIPEGANVIKNEADYIELLVPIDKKISEAGDRVNALQGEFFQKARTFYKLQKELPEIETSVSNAEHNHKVELEKFSREVLRKNKGFACPTTTREGVVLVWHKPKEDRDDGVKAE